jgi:hypothetical protein
MSTRNGLVRQEESQILVAADAEGSYTSKSLGDDKMTNLSEKDAGDDVEYDSSSYAEVYVPYDCQVDGRKREAKRLKSRSKIPQEEVDLEKLVRDYQNSNKKI